MSWTLDRVALVSKIEAAFCPQRRALTDPASEDTIVGSGTNQNQHCTPHSWQPGPCGHHSPCSGLSDLRPVLSHAEGLASRSHASPPGVEIHRNIVGGYRY